MRCYCCDVRLSPREACTKFEESGRFTETCNKCLKTMGVNTVSPKREFEEDEEDEQEFIEE
jgi:hypothetical protein